MAAAEEAYAANHTDLQAQLLITAGEKEGKLLENLSPFVSQLQSRGYPGLDLTVHTFADVGHAAAAPAAISWALSVLYNPGWLNE